MPPTPLTLNISTHDGTKEQRRYRDILPQDIESDAVYTNILRAIAPYTMTANEGAETTYSLFHNIKYIVENAIPGDIVECGVWRGGCSMLMALALKYFGDTNRQLYLYDTYDGMTEPDDIDIDFDGVSQKKVWLEGQKGNGKMAFGGTAEHVKTNMQQTSYPESQMHFIAGDVCDTIPGTMPESIALLRLDTDWYKSTLHELTHLYPLLTPGGVLIIDDYGWCKGARQATDEFFATQAFKPMMHRVNECVRVLIKPPA